MSTRADEFHREWIRRYEEKNLITNERTEAEDYIARHETEQNSLRNDIAKREAEIRERKAHRDRLIKREHEMQSQLDVSRFINC